MTQDTPTPQSGSLCEDEGCPHSGTLHVCVSSQVADAATIRAQANWTLADLRVANIARQAEWCPDQVPDLSFRGMELAGEVGEALNVAKKLERERHGWRGSRDTLEHLAEELADVVICADLAAMTAGVDLYSAVRAKFDATSEKVGLATRLLSTATLSSAPQAADGGATLTVARYVLRDLHAKHPNCGYGKMAAACEAASRAQAEVARLTAEVERLKGAVAEAGDMTWFWQIIDEAGLADVPSNEKGALRLLTLRAAHLVTTTAQLATVAAERDEARARFKAAADPFVGYLGAYTDLRSGNPSVPDAQKVAGTSITFGDLRRLEAAVPSASLRAAPTDRPGEGGAGDGGALG